MIRSLQRGVLFVLHVPLAALVGGLAPAVAQGPPRLLGWNDLGMHCMDGDTSVFSILPPFNTFHAQLMVGGQLMTAGNYTVTYEAVADPTGSINTSSIGKTDFWQHAQALFGAVLQLDEGLAGFHMPGAANTPQSMPFHTDLADYVAVGVPVTPYDDAGVMNPYPLMRLVARNAQGTVVASTDAVTPVSAEMACVSCHGSGGNPAARPTNGWLHGSPTTDDRLNTCNSTTTVRRATPCTPPPCRPSATRRAVCGPRLGRARRCSVRAVTAAMRSRPRASPVWRR